MSMIKRDADRAADILIKKLGTDALIYTTLRLEEMREACDPEGLAVWTRVHEAAQYRLKRHDAERQSQVTGRSTPDSSKPAITRNL